MTSSPSSRPTRAATPEDWLRPSEIDERDAPDAIGPVSRQTWLLLLGVLVATIIAFAPIFYGQPLWQDDRTVFDNPTLRSGSALRWYWLHPHAVPDYRPAATTLRWLEFNLWHARFVPGYKLVSLTLHLLSTTLVWLLLRRLRMRAALMAALLFGIHPAGLQAVGWITLQPALLASACALGAVVLLLRALGWDDFVDPGYEERALLRLPSSSVLLHTSAVMLFGAALLSDPVVALAVPAGLLALGVWKRGGRNAWLVIGSYAALGITWAVFVRWVTLRFETSPLTGSLVSRLGRAMADVALRQVWPLPGRFVEDVDAAPLGAAYIGVFLASAGALAALLFTRRWCRFGVMVMVTVGVAAVAIAGPSSSVSAVALSGNTYLARLGPLIGLGCALVWIFDWLQRAVERRLHNADIDLGRASARMRVGLARVPAYVILLLPATLLGWTTFRQTSTFYSNANAWKDTAAAYPNSYLAQLQFGSLMLASGDLDQAQSYLQNAYTLSSRPLDVRLRLAEALDRGGRQAEADAVYSDAIAAFPNDPAALRLAAARAAARSDETTALAAYERALALRPDDPVTLNNYATLLATLGRPDDAGSKYRAALKLDPQFNVARLNLAKLLFAQGKFDESAIELQEAVRIDPQSYDAFMTSGVILIRFENYKQAEEMFRFAMRIRPDSLEAASQLAGVLVTEKKYPEAIFLYKRILLSDPQFPGARERLQAAERDRPARP